MSELAKKFTAAAATLQRQIDETRVQIAATYEEIDWLKSAPPPKVEVVELACAAIDLEAADFVSSARWGGFVHAGEIGELFEMSGRTEIIVPGSPIAGMHLRAAPLFAFLFGAELKEKLAAAIEQGTVDFEEGPAMGDRPALIESARDRLFAMETEEESLIEEAAAAGIEIARRASADPAVILGAYEAHCYRFRAHPVDGEYFYGEVEVGEMLTRDEIVARATDAVPAEWRAQYQLESIEVIEPLDSEDIIEDGDDDQQPRATTRRASRRKQFISKGFEPDQEKAAIERDLVVADNPPRMK